MADGAIARRTKSDSELGAILDTIADIVFVAVCFKDTANNAISCLAMDLDCHYSHH